MNKLNISQIGKEVKSQEVKLELNRWQTVEDIAKMLNGILEDNVIIKFEAQRKSRMKTVLTVKIKEEEVIEKPVVLAKGKGIGTSQYRGVFWCKDTGKWRVIITKLDGKRKHIGRYYNETQAAMAYDKAIYNERGLDAYFNFPETIKVLHENKVVK